ncbi:hypothetical protein FGD67_12490 [Colwellia sp. M166]|uniref:hypothetical protein n=1 Tax=Colwellia sp. M166 TaxID=2583805 RepID=UPI00211DCF2C|nr:hypothetical protein [Colwellia sp. M166]UUO23952.1 hypothetical protein FGD67_12490 [Colwellia sp. M166]
MQQSKLYKRFFSLYWVISVAVSFSSALHAEQSQTLDRDQWLKARFGAQHDALIPIVAVADMLYGCQQTKHADNSVNIKSLITQLDKNNLAEKLIACLAGESLKSDEALNYGLTGCFNEQFAHLPLAEKQQKMALVSKAINGLSRVERQKSFTQCVTEQAIHYLR